LEGKGKVVEWAVKMRELDQRYLLSHLLKDGSAVSPAEIDGVLNVLMPFYAKQATLTEAEQATATQRLRQSIFDNFKTAQAFIGRVLSQAAYDTLSDFNEMFFERKAALLQSRIDRGWIRDCHGDLHTEHIHLTPERVCIYDCIEFNTRFRHIDVACDLAFLAMDLDFHGRADLARHLVSRAAEHLADADMPRLLSFYQCYRACVRGKVACLQSRSGTMQGSEKEESLELASRYFQLGLRYATLGAGSGVVVVMGKVASGKSTLALALSKMLGCEVLSSDRVRKALAGIPADKRGNPEERTMLYASGMTERTYGELAEGAVKNLSHRGWTIVDATFSKKRDREALNSAITRKGGRCVWVEAKAGDPATRERLRAREKSRGVVSDARLEDREMLDAAYEKPDEMADCLSLENEGGVDKTIGRLLARLAERQVEV
jgi:aminoglycoside phosphotransferase family enzyme/predicted kinase